jgi:hypothetical protein
MFMPFAADRVTVMQAGALPSQVWNVYASYWRVPGALVPGNGLFTPHELATPSRKCLTATVPVEPVKPAPFAGAVKSRVELMLTGPGPVATLKFIICGLTPPVKVTVSVN